MATGEEWSGDWRSWLTDARQGLVGFIKFVASSTLFVLVLASFALWKPALQSIAKVVRCLGGGVLGGGSRVALQAAA